MKLGVPDGRKEWPFATVLRLPCLRGALRPAPHSAQLGTTLMKSAPIPGLLRQFLFPEGQQIWALTLGSCQKLSVLPGEGRVPHLPRPYCIASVFPFYLSQPVQPHHLTLRFCLVWQPFTCASVSETLCRASLTQSLKIQCLSPELRGHREATNEHRLSIECWAGLAWPVGSLLQPPLPQAQS